MHLLCVGTGGEFDPRTAKEGKERVEQRQEKRGKDRREGERERKGTKDKNGRKEYWRFLKTV